MKPNAGVRHHRIEARAARRRHRKAAGRSKRQAQHSLTRAVDRRPHVTSLPAPALPALAVAVQTNERRSWWRNLLRRQTDGRRTPNRSGRP